MTGREARAKVLGSCIAVVGPAGCGRRCWGVNDGIVSTASLVIGVAAAVPK
jgi:hypothetical protein